MELIQDWKIFQNFFYTKKKIQNFDGLIESKKPIFFIIDSSSSNSVISIYSADEDLSEWLGTSESTVRKEFSHREMHFYRKKEVDEWMKESMSLGNFFDQMSFFQKKAQLNNDTLLRSTPQNHFLIKLIKSKWASLFPSHYGIFICLDFDLSNSILITIHKNSIESFHCPDFSQLNLDRKKIPSELIRFLKEDYYIPIQGIFISQKQWIEWSDGVHPWSKILKVFKSDPSLFTPMKWRMLGLIAWKAYWGN